MLGFVFYLERVFHVDLLLQKISSTAYGGRSIANWGDTDVLAGAVERGLELLTAPPTSKVLSYSFIPPPISLPCSLPHALLQPSEFNCKIAKTLLFFSSVLYENEASFQDALERHKESWYVLSPTTLLLLLFRLSSVSSLLSPVLTK